MSAIWTDNLKKITNFTLTNSTESRPPVRIGDLLLITLGMLVYAASINLFLVKDHLLSGGLTGLALIGQYSFGLPVAALFFILNIPLILLGWFRLNRRFTGLSILGIAAAALGLAVTRTWVSLVPLEDPLLCGILGGAGKGLGLALALSHQGSSGGMDLLAVYLRKRDSGMMIGRYYFLGNAAIVLIGAWRFGLASGVYTAVSLYVAALVIEKYITRFSPRKALLIISRRPEEIAQVIKHEINRGVTYLYGEGVYTQDNYKVIFCIVPARQLYATKQSILGIDPRAFLSVINMAEVEGLGFYQQA